jgi:hypothetical protein
MHIYPLKSYIIRRVKQKDFELMKNKAAVNAFTPWALIV